MENNTNSTIQTPLGTVLVVDTKPAPAILANKHVPNKPRIVIPSSPSVHAVVYQSALTLDSLAFMIHRLKSSDPNDALLSQVHQKVEDLAALLHNMAHSDVLPPTAQLETMARMVQHSWRDTAPKTCLSNAYAHFNLDPPALDITATGADHTPVWTVGVPALYSAKPTVFHSRSKRAAENLAYAYMCHHLVKENGVPETECPYFIVLLDSVAQHPQC